MQRYLPALEEEAGRAKTLDDRVAQVDFTLVQYILLMVNQIQNKLDKIEFRDENEKCLASLTLEIDSLGSLRGKPDGTRPLLTRQTVHW